MLSALNVEFYERFGKSFFETRHYPWQGWELFWKLLQEYVGCKNPLSVLDVASGNGRFARFLAEKASRQNLSYYSVDLAPEASQQLDIVGTLLKAVYEDGPSLENLIDAPLCNLAVLFGFMHHVPVHAARVELLRSLLAHTVPGGICVVSFWQFAPGSLQAYKARSSTDTALTFCPELCDCTLDKDDYILGWQNIPGAWRYCHSYSDEEIDMLVRELSLLLSTPLKMRFSADHTKKGACNVYLVWQA